VGKRVEVFDFIYVDAPRVKSLISQLDEDGPLAEMTSTDALEADKESGLGGNLGSENLAGVKASKGTRRKTIEYVQRRYEVQFALPIDLLDLLNEHELVQRQTSSFRFGTLAEFTGDLFIMDLASLHSGWEGMIKGAAGLDQADEAAAMAIFSSMPPAVHAVFYRGTAKVWSMLVSENWIVPPQSITLSHGSRVPGDWKILGVVEALPSDKQAAPNDKPMDNQLGPTFDILGPKMREMMGRPNDCFGMTPILVYRSITRKS